MIAITNIARKGTTFGPKGDAQMDITYAIEGYPNEVVVVAYDLARKKYVQSDLCKKHLGQGLNLVVAYYGNDRGQTLLFPALYEPRFYHDPTKLTLLSVEAIEAALAAFNEIVEEMIPVAQTYMNIKKIVEASGLQYFGTSKNEDGYGYSVHVCLNSADLQMTNEKGDGVCVEYSVWGTKYGLTFKESLPQRFDESDITVVGEADINNLPEYCKMVRVDLRNKCIDALEKNVLWKRANDLLEIKSRKYNFHPYLRFKMNGKGAYRGLILEGDGLSSDEPFDVLPLPQSVGLDGCLDIINKTMGTDEALADLARSLGIEYTPPLVESDEVVEAREKARQERVRIATLEKNRAEKRAKQDLANAWTALGAEARKKYGGKRGGDA